MKKLLIFTLIMAVVLGGCAKSPFELDDEANIADLNEHLDFYGIKLMMSEEDLLKNEYVEKEPGYGIESPITTKLYYVNNLENGERLRGGGVDHIIVEEVDGKEKVKSITMDDSKTKNGVYAIKLNSLLEGA